MKYSSNRTQIITCGVIVLIMVALVFQNMKVIDRIDTLSNELTFLRNESMQVASEVRVIQTDIRNDLKEDDLIESYEISRTELDDQNVEINVEIAIQKVEKEASLYLMYRDLTPRSKSSLTKVVTQGVKATGEWRLSELDDVAKGVYMARFIANKSLRYELKVVAEGDEATVTQALDEVNFDVDFSAIVDGEMQLEELVSTGEVRYRGWVFVESKDGLKIEKALCKLLYQGEVVDTFDLVEADSHGESVNERDLFGERQYFHETDQALRPKDLSFEMVVQLSDDSVYNGSWSDELW